MTPWFIATEKFDGTDSGWPKYIAWSRLAQLDELVSLDASLCPSVLREIKSDYWNHIVNEDFMLRFFTDFDYLYKETAGIARKNLLCVFRNAPEIPANVPEGFAFLGFDLVDKSTSISALTNCGGFPNVFSNDELSAKGLIERFVRAREIQNYLRRLYPNEPHADCHLWAIFRRA